MRTVWLVLLVTAACGGGGAGPELALDAGGAAASFQRGSSPPSGATIAGQADASGARDVGAAGDAVALEPPPAADAGAEDASGSWPPAACTVMPRLGVSCDAVVHGSKCQRCLADGNDSRSSIVQPGAPCLSRGIDLCVYSCDECAP